MARELVKVVYAVWAKGVDYQDARPVRPGSGKDTNKSKNNSKKMNKNKQSRSETGQLLHPMVHAVSA